MRREKRMEAATEAMLIAKATSMSSSFLSCSFLLNLLPLFDVASY